MPERKTFAAELEELLNKHSMENGSNTPDFILAAYLSECFAAFGRAVVAREKWYGVECVPGGQTLSSKIAEICDNIEAYRRGGMDGESVQKLYDDLRELIGIKKETTGDSSGSSQGR